MTADFSAGLATTRATICRTLGLDAPKDATDVYATELLSRLVSAAIISVSALRRAKKSPPREWNPAVPERQLPRSCYLNNNGERMDMNGRWCVYRLFNSIRIVTSKDYLTC